MDDLMARPRKAAGLKTNATDLHRAWLQLVDTDGPFLAIPPLKRVWPNGIPDFRATHLDQFETLVEARKAFENSWETLDRDSDSDIRLGGYRTERDKWVETVLRDVVGWGESLEWGIVPGVEVQSPNRAVTVAAQGALVSVGGIGALVLVVDPTDSLRQTPSDLWAATPVDRCEALLRENRVEIGIVTDGRWWGLVCAREGSMAASGIVDSLTWVEEPRARDAFLTLIRRQHIIGGDPAERLPVLFEESIAAAEEITEALGAQVRRAVELLIQSFSESAAEAKRRGLPDPLPDRNHDTYEAAVTVMMRTVFLLFAEERGLLPSGELFEQGYGIAGELDRLTARENDESEEALDATSLTWHRLLATSQALYKGASFENLRMPAYGGSLFDPARFLFLTDTTEQGALAVTVSDRVMLHVLRSVQKAEVKAEARQISFRDIDVEQIGYIYEGLLGYTATRVSEPTLGIIGTTGAEPEIPLAILEELSVTYPEPKKLAVAIRDWVAKGQPSASPSSAAAITKAIIAKADPSVISALTQTVGDDNTLRDRIKPWLGLIRPDLRGHPFVVVAGGLVMKETPSRRNAGAHYTPKSLAEEVVLRALQPLCYSPGPHQTAESEQWKLKSSDELLGLKIADIACGSGAFLVAAARYLADRVVEAWTEEDLANSQRKGLYVRAIRQVVANCLYGADINDMAVEMCKLSLWLVSLDRDLPFSFVDDKVFLGNSLLGLTNIDQLRRLHFDTKRVIPGDMLHIFHIDIDIILRKAVALRERLATEIDEDDPARSSAAKRRQLRELHEVTASLRAIADGVIAAGLPHGGKPSRALDEAYENLRAAVKKAHQGTLDQEADSTWLDAIIDNGLTPTVETDYRRWQPLHWVLEAPDVMVGHGGFDAVIGNPPFLAGKKIATANGSNIETWVKADLNGLKGAADISAHFIRRAWLLLVEGGSLGLIATDRIGQGDTALMSTQILVEEGTLYRAVSAFRWPGQASTGAAIIWAWKKSSDYSAMSPILDGRVVSALSPSLDDAGEANVTTASPLKLPFLAGAGIYAYGEGFVLDADAPILANLNEAEQLALRPFVNGQTLMSGVPSGRKVIDVGAYVDEDLLRMDMPNLFEHLRLTVKPARDAITSQVHEHRYWAFWDKREELFQETEKMDRFIALAGDTRVPVFLFMHDHRPVLSHKVVVIASASASALGVLSSSLHSAWFERTRTGRGTTSNYVVSRCLRTFPFPDLENLNLLVAADEFIAARDEALSVITSPTKLYNQLDDPSVNGYSISRLREAQMALDAAVVSSYGWNDLDIHHGFHELAGVVRFTCDSAQRNEMRRRLLEENHRRAAEEAAASPKKTTRGRKTKSASEGMETLFS
ncbi:Eco57I restriction-modification methylase domain-containing protein [Arthrobacter sp. A2-55]|uniref:Eco57I restriction-modification methylase domain-containing protein n=1 Tax=Arthrobacter sp. A2-55 TaxID=2897337 RepID=UPI0021CD7FEF|nr:DNA methyltransferase [Arthrobacter sp. A2-55]MCU6480471.1 SAM-dependent DNA methyltransferase [Arthrobacter sp. A2-55]